MNQAVTENPDAPSETVAEGADAPDELDALLNEFDSSGQTPEQPAQPVQPAQPADVTEVVNYVRQQQALDQQESIDTALADGVKVIQKSLESLPFKVDDAFLLNQFYGEGANDKRIQQAFDNRQANPKAWDAVVSMISSKVKDMFVPVDGQSTDSWKAVESAVHTASTQTESQDNVEVSSMSDAQFEMHKAALRRG